MAAKNLLESLKVDLTCPVCLGYFTDPVIAKCGHSFCKKCLLRCLEDVNTPGTCPECRTIIQYGDFLCNRRLQSLAMVGKLFKPHLIESLTICDKHKKEEYLFCENDHRPLLFPLEKAAGQFMMELQKTWKILRERKETCQIDLENEKIRELCCKKEGYAFKELVISEYKKMHQFWFEEEQLYLQRLDQEAKDSLAKSEERKVRLSQQIYKLQMILESFFEMIKDVKGILGRKEKLLLQDPVVASPRWTKFSIPGMTEMLMTFQRDLTLDPETANSHLIISKDLKSVRYVSIPQDLLADNIEQFDFPIALLAIQSFISGKHYWEVEVKDEIQWQVGICKISDNKKRQLLLCLEHTSIGFQLRNDFDFWNSYDNIHVSSPIHKLGIFLDYERGQITFYNAIDRTLIYNPPKVAFCGSLYPCFSLYPPNEEITHGSLIICPRNNW
uniref:Uncharacterized protein n=1 Tax=Monodelphis domestica TaxID=13616 RepID=F6WC71_MONDO